MTKDNKFAAIIAERQKDEVKEEPAPKKVSSNSKKKKRIAKRGHPDYSPVTVYIPTDIYTLAQFEMAKKGRKREMSELFAELLEAWLKKQK